MRVVNLLLGRPKVLKEGDIVNAGGKYRLPESCRLSNLRGGKVQVTHLGKAYNHEIGVGNEPGRYVECDSVRADAEAGKW